MLILPRKKTTSLTEREQQTRALILEVKRLSYEEQLSNTQIKNLLHMSYRRIKRYISGDADTQCRDGRSTPRARGSSVAAFHEMIRPWVEENLEYKEIFARIRELGYEGSYTTMAKYCLKCFGKKHGSRVSSPSGCHYINRNDIFAHIWSDKPLETYDKQYVFTTNPELFTLRDMIYQFRKTLNGKDSTLISSWADNIMAGSLFAPIVTFANGLRRDMKAVMNSIAYTYTNAFLEGNVNRLKMIKRSMFGRAGYDLLRAKVLGLSTGV